MLKKILSVIITALMVFAMAGCERSGLAESSGDSLTILTSFAPVYALTLNVTDGVSGVKVVNMAAPSTGCLHDYQLTTADMRKAESADVFIINGGGMEGFMDKVFSLYKGKTIIDTSEGVALLESAETNPDHADADHTKNAHIWLSIGNAQKQVENIMNGLVLADPKHEALYRKNAEAFIQRLDTLKKAYLDGLKDIKTRDIVTFHEAFSYLARDYGLNVVEVVMTEPGVSPDPKTLQSLIDTVKQKKIKAIFDEPQYGNSTADLIAKSTGAKLYTLDPMVTGTMDKNSYISVMTENLNTLKKALS